LASPSTLKHSLNRNASDQNGSVFASKGEIVCLFSPSRFVRLAAGTAAQRTKVRSLASTTYWVALGYYQDLPFGFSINVEPALA